jgi:excisionase family DNA binding protein
MPTAETPTRLLTLPQVAERLNVSRATAYRWVAGGRLPALQLGGHGTPLRVDEAALETWLRTVPAERGVPAPGQSTSPPLAGHGDAA